MKDKTKRIFLAFGKMIKTQLSVNHSDLSEFKSFFFKSTLSVKIAPACRRQVLFLNIFMQNTTLFVFNYLIELVSI
ncbi:MAG: hypothetical protein PHS59_02070 [Paludibacter sp.]|nr:hypothetical protein [Paludibacter sp.]